MVEKRSRRKKENGLWRKNQESLRRLLAKLLVLTLVLTMTQWNLVVSNVAKDSRTVFGALLASPSDATPSDSVIVDGENETATDSNAEQIEDGLVKFPKEALTPECLKEAAYQALTEENYFDFDAFGQLIIMDEAYVEIQDTYTAAFEGTVPFLLFADNGRGGKLEAYSNRSVDAYMKVVVRVPEEDYIAYEESRPADIVIDGMEGEDVEETVNVFENADYVFLLINEDDEDLDIQVNIEGVDFPSVALPEFEKLVSFYDDSYVEESYEGMIDAGNIVDKATPSEKGIIYIAGDGTENKAEEEIWEEQIATPSDAAPTETAPIESDTTAGTVKEGTTDWYEAEVDGGELEIAAPVAMEPSMGGGIALFSLLGEIIAPTEKNQGLKAEAGVLMASVSVMALEAGVVPLAEETIQAQNYYEAIEIADGVSTNSHYTINGFYVDSDGNAHVLLQLKNSETVQKIDELAILTTAGKEMLVSLSPNDQVKRSSDIYFENDGVVIKDIHNPTGFYDLNTGHTIQELGYDFKVAIDSGTSGSYGTGWDITKPGLGIELVLDYRITKWVYQVNDEPVAESQPDPENAVTVDVGDWIIYRIRIENTGEVPVMGIQLAESEPEGVHFTEWREVGSTVWNSIGSSVDENGHIILDSDISLGTEVGQQVKEYEVKAEVNGTVIGEDITNIAAMEGDALLPKDDTASVIINAVPLTIEKDVTGTLGDRFKLFVFEAKIVNVDETPYIPADAEDKDEDGYIEFTLAHDQTVDFAQIPVGAKICIRELNAFGYTTTVAGEELSAPSAWSKPIILTRDNLVDGKFVITVNNHREAVPDTGVLLDSIPYILILAMALGGIAVYAFHKRKKNDSNLD